MFDYFIGVQQSKYAGYAMLSVILLTCLAILFTSAPFLYKIGAIIALLVISIIPIGISLFELTCIVTGGQTEKTSWCNTYAWILVAIIIFYCFILAIVIFSSIFTYQKATTNVIATEKAGKVSHEETEKITKKIIEKYMSAPENSTMNGGEDMMYDMNTMNTMITPEAVIGGDNMSYEMPKVESFMQNNDIMNVSGVTEQYENFDIPGGYETSTFAEIEKFENIYHDTNEEYTNEKKKDKKNEPTNEPEPFFVENNHQLL